MIYFIQCDMTLRVKIGFSAKPWKRFSKIQSDAPGALTMLAIIEGATKDEAAFHERFASSKVRGEWFEPDGPMRAFLATLPAPTREKPGTRFKWGKSALTDGDICRLTGLSRAQVNRIRNRRTDPSFRVAVQIVAATGMALADLGIAA